jgi:hypothetical protein
VIIRITSLSYSRWQLVTNLLHAQRNGRLKPSRFPHRTMMQRINMRDWSALRPRSRSECADDQITFALVPKRDGVFISPRLLG